ncbi:MAG TPA: hypothetical protein VI279_17035 [Rhodocyclaceae bacterium]
MTLIALVLLFAGVVALYFDERFHSDYLAFPLGALALNLLAAIVSNGAFRKQLWLMVFHLALLTLVSLLAVSRLSYLRGTLELSDGGEFTGALVEQRAGLLHPLEKLQALRFANLGFHIDYVPGPLPHGIRNLIEVRDGSGIPRQMEITDQQPLLLAGYRFYPTTNKGFAPTFDWRPTGGQSITGTVNLPSYPVHEHGQAREWTPPGASFKLWTQLQFDEVIVPADRPSQFHLPQKHIIVLRLGEQRWELTPGQSVDLPGGRITYQGLRGWMGYEVFYDWTIPWLLAACLLAVGAMGMHFWSKFSARPWNGEAA